MTWQQFARTPRGARCPQPHSRSGALLLIYARFCVLSSIFFLRLLFPSCFITLLPTGGYLGDAFPVCADLPPRAYLLRGAQYHRTGSKSTLGSTFDNADGEMNGKLREHFTPDPKSSGVYAALCQRDDSTGKCTFPADVELQTNLACTGKVECGADTLVSVKIVDDDRVVFYSYVEPPCVEMAFFDNGKQVGQYWANQCAAPDTVGISGVACCQESAADQNGFTASILASNGGDECLYIAEPMKFTTAEKRCAAEHEGGILCPSTVGFGLSSPHNASSPDWLGTCAGNQYTWHNNDCKLKVQVQPSGEVNIHDPLTNNFREDLRLHSGEYIDHELIKGLSRTLACTHARTHAHAWIQVSLSMFAWIVRGVRGY